MHQAMIDDVSMWCRSVSEWVYSVHEFRLMLRTVDEFTPWLI